MCAIYRYIAMAIYVFIGIYMRGDRELHILLAKVKQKLSQLKTFYSKHFLALVVFTLHISVCTSWILMLLTCHAVNWQNDWQEASFSEHSTFNLQSTAHSHGRRDDVVVVVRLICHYLYGHLKSFEWNVRQSDADQVRGDRAIPR